VKKFLVVIFMLVFEVGIAGGAELKIGYVDLNKALNESESGKKATKILEDMVKSKRVIIAKKEEEINNLREEIGKQSSVLTQEAVKEKQDNLDRVIRDAQKMTKEFQDEVQKKEFELRTELLNELKEIINKIAEEEGYAFILEESTLLYSSKKFDITQKVIKKHNETVKTKK